MGSTLQDLGPATDQTSAARSGDRHSHIGIGLRCQINGTWERIEALGWNEAGFNFYSPFAIEDPVLSLKRGITCFQGSIAWNSTSSDEALLSMLVNQLIFDQAKRFSSNVALHKRLIKLIRVPGLIEQKRAILASIGLEISDSELANLLARKKLDRPMFHYGVNVESDQWRGIVTNAFDVSAVVISMEKWANSFSPK